MRVRFGRSEFLFSEQARPTSVQSGSWHYEQQGQRKGPVSKEQILELYESGQLNADSLVWSLGFTEWKRLADVSTFAGKIKSPPPLPESKINNTAVWWLSVTPILGSLTEIIVSNRVGIAVADLWWITVALNIGLALYDDNKLKRAGHEAPSSLLTVIVPLYLILRSAKLRQTHAYTVVWFLALIVSVAIDVYAAPTWSESKAASDSEIAQLHQAMLIVRPGIADLGAMKVGNLLDCFKRAPNPSRVVSESNKGYGRYLVHLENNKGEWLELNFRLMGSAALLEATQFGDGTSSDNWSEILVFVAAVCSASAPGAATSP